MPAKLTPQEFIAKWQHATLKERSAYQQHFLDVCALVGHAAPADVDSSGTFFTFEAGATKQDGSQGWADVWYRSHFAWEYKGKHANLDKAYQQLLQYREALENPPLLIVSDIDQIVIHTNFTNTVKQVYTIPLEALKKPDQLAILAAAFFDPEKLKAAQTTEQVTREAAKQFAKLADGLRAYGEQPPRVAHFLIQLLFCLFAEDVGLLPERAFTRMLQSAGGKTGLFSQQLANLFQAMATGGLFGFDHIPYFNGRLFEQADVLDLDSDGLHTLAEVSRLDWSNIEPSIFGTLFERSLDPKKRSQLGAHFTGEPDIVLVVEPVLMAPLRRKWLVVQEQARDLAAKRDQSKGQARKNRETELRKLLLGFAHEIASIQVLDTACGCGNFLYVSLRLLHDLEKEVITLAGVLGVGTFFPSVSPEQLHGIEINPYAHQLAQATIWIGHIQWLRENGYGIPSEPILKPLDNIQLMDAILAFDEQSNPVEPEWPEAYVIVGNPPFLGDKKMRAEMGREYVDRLRKLYEGRVPGGADLVTYWFEKARAMVDAEKVKRVGLLATQSIRVGANRKVLDRIKETGDIFMAWSDRPWVLDGAQVRVSMVGFDDGQDDQRFLDGNQVTSINSNLTTEIDLTKAKVLLENTNISFVGTQKGGEFELDNVIAVEMQSSKGNPNGKPNSDVIKPWVNAFDVTGRPRNMWIIDFGTDTSLEEASLYKEPFEHVKKMVKPVRDNLNRKNHREKWWLFAEARPGMRKALSSLHRYIASPRVAKHRLFVFLPSETVPDSRLLVITRDDDYFFGVLHSRVHEVWSLATSPRHGVGNDPTYNAQSCFETFPFPWPPGQEPQDDLRVQAIGAAAQDLVQRRDYVLQADPTLTLTGLYNERPTWLDLVHKKLDQAVLAAYGWPDNLSDDEILERLLALNLERAGKS